MNKAQVFRWKSNRFEIHQGKDSPYFWLMNATKREERIPFTLTELKELHDLIAQILNDCEIKPGGRNFSVPDDGE